MKVFGYIRVSSKGQLEGDGPERQDAAIRAFCEAHTLPLEFCEEEAITGTKEGLDRPVFSGILFQKAPCVVVVEKMDRLARDLIVSEVLLRECRKHGVKIYAADQGLFDLAGAEADEPSRKLIRQILGAVAEFEKSALVAKLTAAKNRVRAKTGWCGGGRPYGYSDPHEQRIKLMAMDFVKAGHSLPQTARLLNEAGFKTRMGKQWTGMTVYAITRKKK